MSTSERIRELLEKYSAGKLSQKEQDQLFELLQSEHSEEAASGWFFSRWEEADRKTSKLNSLELLQDIRIGAGLDGYSSQEEKDYTEFMLNRRRKNEKRVFPGFLLKIAAIVTVGLLAAYFTIVLSGNQEREIAYNEIEVAYGSRSNLLLPDGTRVWLNSGSRMVYPDRFSKDSRDVYLKGEAFFDVKSIPGKNFIVRTDDIRIRVTGTKFNVKSYPEEKTIETTLVSGSVTIERKQSEPVVHLKPQEIAVYQKESRKLTISKISELTGEGEGKVTTGRITLPRTENVLTGWIDEKLVFQNERFEDLALRMERWYNVRIMIEDSTLREVRFTGSFEKETIEQALAALRLAAPFNVTTSKNTISIKPKTK